MAMFVGTASAQSDRAIGRGFIGVVTGVTTSAVASAVASGDSSVSVLDLTLTVETKRAVFQLAVTDSTVINNPPDRDVGLAGLPKAPGFRIAGLVDTAIIDADGNVVPEARIALKITVIPGKATRSHKRTIAADKQGDNLTTLDDDGNKTEHPGRAAGFEKGDRIIVLIQKSGGGGDGGTVRGLFKAKHVDERLDRFSDAQTDDPLKAGVLADLRNKREDDQEERLNKTSENAGTEFRDFVLNQVRIFRRARQARLTRTGIRRAIFECARSIAGLRVASVSDLDANQRQRVTAECLTITKAALDQSPVIRITSPSFGTVVFPNEVVTVTAEAKDDVGVVSVTFTLSGSGRSGSDRQVTLREPPYTADFTVPEDVSSVEIIATAVDADGNEGSDFIILRVPVAAGLGVKITSPATTVTSVLEQDSRRSTVSGSSEPIAEGDTIIIRAEVSGTGAITVVFTVNGVDQTPISEPPYSMRYLVPRTTAAGTRVLKITATATDGSGSVAIDSVSVTIVRETTEVIIKITEPPADAKVTGGDTIVIRTETNDDSVIAFVTFVVDGNETVIRAAPFTQTYVVPRRATAAAAVSNTPPHVFVGKATLDGRPAPDGTVVTAWIAGSDATTLSIKVTATANSGETGSAALSLLVSSSINAGEATVKDGEYVLNASQPSGQNFAGKTVTFAVGGKDAHQTSIWQQGGADILDLTAK